MIELSSKTTTVKGPDGRLFLCDIDDLQRDLKGAFSAAGIHETWLAEHVAAVIRDQEAEEGGNQEAEEGDDILAGLVARLLADAGYPDVAAEFAKLRGQEVDFAAAAEPRSPWDEQRIHQLIRSRMAVSPQLSTRLTERVLAKLETLGFVLVSDLLILGLAEHILAALAQIYRENPAVAAGWLMPPGYWEAFFNGAAARLVANRVLSIHPVSELFPVPQMTLDAVAAVRMEKAEGLGELVFMPRWQALAATVAQAAFILVEEMNRTTPRNRHPVLIHIGGLHPAVDLVFSGRRRRHQADVRRQAVHFLEQALTDVNLRAVVSLDEKK